MTGEELRTALTAPKTTTTSSPVRLISPSDALGGCSLEFGTVLLQQALDECLLILLLGLLLFLLFLLLLLSHTTSRGTSLSRFKRRDIELPGLSELVTHLTVRVGLLIRFCDLNLVGEFCGIDCGCPGFPD